jgi:Tol biopolymer transport system component
MVFYTVFANVYNVAEGQSVQEVPEGKIAYTISTGAGDYRVYTINPDGSGKHLTADSTNYLSVIWSVQGSGIAFTYKGGFQAAHQYQVVFAKTGDVAFTTITQTDDETFPINWSPDGRYISLMQNTLSASTESDLFLFDTQEKKLKVIGKCIKPCEVSWSSKSDQFAYAQKATELTVNLYDIAGNSTKAIKTIPGLISVALSPQADKLAYLVQNTGNSNQSADLVLLNLNTNSEMRVASGNIKEMVWDYGGASIVYSLYTEESINSANLYIYSVSQNNLIQLTQGSFADQSPIWSPDNKNIAFKSNRDSEFPEQSEIYIVDVATQQIERLTFESGFAFPLTWFK